jgi:ribosomal protein S27AE
MVKELLLITEKRYWKIPLDVVRSEKRVGPGAGGGDVESEHEERGRCGARGRRFYPYSL